jgi:hypothetical protein
MAARHEEDIMKTWFAAVAAFISLGLALAACGSAAHTQGSSSTSQRSQLEAVVQCLRTHGVPDFPDPVYDPSDSNWHYANYRPSIPQSAQQACQHLEPSAGNQSPPVPLAQFQALVRLAQCMRENGVPAWPDPTPQGQFRLPPPLLTKTNTAENKAESACQRYMPRGGWNVGAAG